MSEKIVDFKEPFKKFHEWFEIAKKNKDIIEPTAMSIATVGKDLKPSLRMVLLKSFDENGFCFYTNLTSRKSREITENSNVALCFYWGALGRQVRIEGQVISIDQKEADNYFHSRPRDSQIGAWASKQSQIMENWQDLENRILAINEQFENQEIPRPPFWSGYRVIANNIEFWEEGKYRIHNRLLYKRQNNKWLLNKLYP
jgi:pyridoxamine 5'-phosphate oxidase